MDGPHLQGIGGVQPSGSKKRRRTSLPTSTTALEVEIVQPSNGGNQKTSILVNAQEIAASPSGPEEQHGLYNREEQGLGNREEQQGLPNNDIGWVGEDECAENYDWEVKEVGDREEEDNDIGWVGEDMDEDARGGYVEGRIDPEMMDSFFRRDENRQFRSKVWNEFSKIRVAGIVTKGQCIHCNAEISAKRGAGTSAMGTHLKRCKVRQSVTNMSCQLRSVVMSPEVVALENWRFSQDVSRRELTRMITLHRFSQRLL